MNHIDHYNKEQCHLSPPSLEILSEVVFIDYISTWLQETSTSMPVFHQVHLDEKINCNCLSLENISNDLFINNDNEKNKSFSNDYDVNSKSHFVKPISNTIHNEERLKNKIYNKPKLKHKKNIINEQNKAHPHLRNDSNISISYLKTILKSIDKNFIFENIQELLQYLNKLLPHRILCVLLNKIWEILFQTIHNFDHFYLQDQININSNNIIIRIKELLQKSLLLCAIANISEVKFSLNLAAIRPFSNYFLQVVNNCFPVQQFNQIIIKDNYYNKINTKFRFHCQCDLSFLLHEAALTSVTILSYNCDDFLLNKLADLALTELEIGLGPVSDGGILKNLCKLPYTSSKVILDDIINGAVFTQGPSKLKFSLQKLRLKFLSLSTSVYEILLICFQNLQIYQPSLNIIPFILNTYDRYYIIPTNSQLQHDSLFTLQLTSIDTEKYSVSDFNKIAIVCPHINEIKLQICENNTEIINSIKLFKNLIYLEIEYCDSETKYKLISTDILESLISNFRNQLKKITLHNFFIKPKLFLPITNLTHVELYNCYADIVSDKTVYNPRNLISLTLNFLPDFDSLHCLLKQWNVKQFRIQQPSSEFYGNIMSHNYLKRLILSGTLNYVEKLDITSACCNIDSILLLRCLPDLRKIGHLDSWGLSQSEKIQINNLSNYQQYLW